MAAMKPRTAPQQYCCPEAAVPDRQQCCPEAVKLDSRACFQEARIKDNRYDDYYLTFLHVFASIQCKTATSLRCLTCSCSLVAGGHDVLLPWEAKRRESKKPTTVWATKSFGAPDKVVPQVWNSLKLSKAANEVHS